jgi:hypothetical protein
MAVSKADANVVIKINVQDKEARAKLLGLASQLKVLDGLGDDQTAPRRKTRLQKFGSDIENVSKKLDNMITKLADTKLMFRSLNDDIDAGSSALERNKQAWADLRLNFNGLKGDVRGVRDQFNSLNGDTGRLYDKLKKLDVELRQKSKDVSRLKSDFDKLDKGIGNARKNVDRMRGGVSQLGRWFSQLMKLVKFVVIEFGVMALAIGALKLALFAGELAVKAFDVTMRGLGVAVGWTAGTVVAGIGTILAAVRQLNMAKLAPLLAPQVQASGLGGAGQASLLEASRGLAMFEAQTLTSITAEAARAGTTIDGQFLNLVKTLGNFAIVASDPNTALSELTVAFLQASKEGKVTEDIFESIAQASPDLKKGFEEVYGSGKKLEQALKSGKVSFSSLLQMFEDGTVKSLEPFQDALDGVNNTLIGRLKQSLKGVKEQLIELGAPLLEVLIGPLGALERNVRIFLFRVKPTIQNVFSQLFPSDGGSTMPRFFDSLAKAVNEHLPKMVGFLDRMRDGWQSFSQGWSGFFGKIGKYLKDVTSSWNTLWNKILKPIGTEFFEIVDHAIREFGGFIEEGNFDTFASKLSVISDGIKDLITGFNELRKVLAPIVSSVLTLLSALMQILKLPGMGMLAATAGLGMYMSRGGGPASRAQANGRNPGIFARMGSLPLLAFSGLAALGNRQTRAPGVLRTAYSSQRNPTGTQPAYPHLQGQTITATGYAGAALRQMQAARVPIPPKTRLQSAAYAAGYKYATLSRGTKMAAVGAPLAVGGMIAGDAIAGNDPLNRGRTVLGSALGSGAAMAGTAALFAAPAGPKVAAAAALVGFTIGTVQGAIAGGKANDDAVGSARETANELAQSRAFSGLRPNDLFQRRDRVQDLQEEIRAIGLLQHYEAGNLKNLNASQLAYLESKKLEVENIKDLPQYLTNLNKHYGTLMNQQALLNTNTMALSDVLGVTASEASDLARSMDKDLSEQFLGLKDVATALGYSMDNTGKILDNTASRAQGAGRLLAHVMEPVLQIIDKIEVTSRSQQALSELSSAIESGDQSEITTAAADMISIAAENEIERFQRGEVSFDQMISNLIQNLTIENDSLRRFYSETRPGQPATGAEIYGNLSAEAIQRLRSAETQFSQRLQFDPAFGLRVQNLLGQQAGPLSSKINELTSKGIDPWDATQQVLAEGAQNIAKELEKQGIKFDPNNLNTLEILLRDELVNGGHSIGNQIKTALEQTAVRIDWMSGMPEWMPAIADFFTRGIPQKPTATPAEIIDRNTRRKQFEKPSPVPGQPSSTTVPTPAQAAPTTPPPPNPGNTTPRSTSPTTTTTVPTTQSTQQSVVFKNGAIQANVSGVFDPRIVSDEIAAAIEEALKRRGERGYGTPR